MIHQIQCVLANIRILSCFYLSASYLIFCFSLLFYKARTILQQSELHNSPLFRVCTQKFIVGLRDSKTFRRHGLEHSPPHPCTQTAKLWAPSMPREFCRATSRTNNAWDNGQERKTSVVDRNTSRANHRVPRPPSCVLLNCWADQYWGHYRTIGGQLSC